MADTPVSGALTEIGSSGLRHFGGMVDEEFLNQLRGRNAYKKFREMADNDPVVGGVLTAIKHTVKRAEWRVKTDGESARDKEAAEFVEGCMSDMEKSWPQFVSSAMSMVEYGFAPFEILYKRRNGDPHDPVLGSKYNDGRIGWQDLALRSQDTVFEWEIDDYGRTMGLVQQAAPSYKTVKIPGWKLINFRAGDHKNSPEGKSILRNAYIPYFRKKRIEEVEGIGLERDLTGIPTAYVPPSLLRKDATEEERATLQAIQQMLKNVRQDKNAGMIFPLAYNDSGHELFKFDLMSSRSRRAHDTTKIINRYNKVIASSMLADFILIGHENVGSFALASSKTHLFSVALGAFLDEIRDVINRHAIPRLLKLNGMADVVLPEVEYTDVENIELDQLARYVSALQAAGLKLDDDESAQYLRAQANMPHELSLLGDDDDDLDDDLDDEGDDDV